MRSFASSALWATLPIVLAACSSSVAADDTSHHALEGVAPPPSAAAGPTAPGALPSPAPTGESALPELVAAYCARVDECHLEGWYGDAAHCNAIFAKALASALGSPGVAPRSADAVRACARAVENEPSCDRAVEWQSLAACAPAPGTLDDGAPCHYGSQCKSIACVRESDSDCGRCGAKKAPGASCGSGSECTIGTDCIDGVCKKQGFPGDPCGSDVQCVHGRECVAGRCETTADKCGGCESGELCTSAGTGEADFACAPAHTASVGESCDDGTTLCEAGSFCDDTLVCHAYAQEGEACDETNPCGPLATCDRVTHVCSYAFAAACSGP